MNFKVLPQRYWINRETVPEEERSPGRVGDCKPGQAVFFYTFSRLLIIFRTGCLVGIDTCTKKLNSREYLQIQQAASSAEDIFKEHEENNSKNFTHASIVEFTIFLGGIVVLNNQHYG